VPCGAVALFVSSALRVSRALEDRATSAVLVFFLSVIITATLATVWTVFGNVGFSGRISDHKKMESGLTQA